jgi:fermentation-respiration switch protein FrsA (DUF1100 family)
MSPPKRRMLLTLAVLAMFYALLCVAGCGLYRRALYPAPHDAGPAIPVGARLLELRADDGNPVRALHFPAPTGAPTLVHFHGNGETLRTLLPFGVELHRRGLGVVLVEYRGYGSSPGEPTEQGLYLDARAALDALDRDGVPSARVVLSGTSLGTGVAAEMAVQGRGARLVLMTPYTSIPRLARRFAPFLPTGWIVDDRFDTLSKAPRLRLPVLILHGDADEVVPYAMGQELAAAIPGARLITVPGGHHNDLFALEGEALREALVAHALGRASP